MLVEQINGSFYLNPTPVDSVEEQEMLHVVFDGPPGPEAGRFVECETPDGRSVNAGEWHERGDGLWELRIPRIAADTGEPKEFGADPTNGKSDAAFSGYRKPDLGSDTGEEPSEAIPYRVTEAGREALSRSANAGHTHGRMVNEIYAAMRTAGKGTPDGALSPNGGVDTNKGAG